MEEVQEVRCIRCNKLLGRVPIGTKAEIEMKCPKCKVLHTYRLDEDV